MLPFLQLIIVLVIIITAAKIGGYASYRLGQPAVAGEVLVGLILGPSALNFLQWPMFTDPHLGETITHLAELGVLMLLFIAGLGIHVSDLVKSGQVAALTGFLGFVFSLGMGFVLAIAFSFEPREALFFGLLLAPTSISISAQTLMELRMLRSRVGVSLLGAAVIDDSLAVLGVSLFFAFFGGESAAGLTSALLVLLRMVLYLVLASALGLWLLPRLSQFVNKLPISQGLIAFTFITVLLYAWTAEVLGSMATIIGAFLAGLFFSRSSLKEHIERGFSPLTYGVFVPIFFINVGLSADMRQFSASSLGLLAAMCLVVIISKVSGAGIAGRLGDLADQESLQLGLGMLPRGEVTLIIATVGIAEGFISTDIFSTAVGLVIVTTLLTPPVLRRAFAGVAPPDFSMQKSS